MNKFLLIFILCTFIGTIKARALMKDGEEKEKVGDPVKFVADDSAFYDDSETTKTAVTKNDDIQEDNSELKSDILKAGKNESPELNADEPQIFTDERSGAPLADDVADEDAPVSEAIQRKSEELPILDEVIESEKSGDVVIDVSKTANTQNADEPEHFLSRTGEKSDEITHDEEDIKQSPSEDEENTQNAYPSKYDEPNEDVVEDALRTSRTEREPKLNRSPDHIIEMKGRSAFVANIANEESRSMPQTVLEPDNWLNRRKNIIPQLNLPPPRPNLFFPPNMFPYSSTPFPPLQRNLNQNVFRGFDNIIHQPVQELRSQPRDLLYSTEKKFNKIDDFSLLDTYAFQPPQEETVTTRPFFNQMPPTNLGLPGFLPNPDVNNFGQNIPFFPFPDSIRRF